MSCIRTRIRVGLPTSVTLALLLGGCTVFAAKDDYADYRTVRLAESDTERNRAMSRYLQSHPDGKWAGEMRAKLAATEDEIYETGKATRAGLQYYLDVYPEGAHAEQARARLQALGTVASRRETEEEAEREVERERRADIAEQRREWATQAVGFWVKTLLGIDHWGSPIPEVASENPEFNRAFGKNPRPRCSRTECIKFYQLQYGIPVPGATRISRTLELLLRLRLDEGKLVRAEVLMPNKGFSRWFELEKQTLVTDEDPEQRNQAIEFAIDRIVPVVRQALSDVRAYDFVAEPLEPPKVRAPNQPDPGASTLPDQEAPPPGEPAEPEGGEDSPQDAEPSDAQEEQGSGSAIDQLLDRAVGDEETGEEDAPAPEPEPEPETMSIPMAVAGFQSASLRVGVFASAAEDFGRAYDGLYIEIVPEQAASEQAASE